MATYKGIQGYSVQKLSSDPTASEAAGQLWYNSTTGKFKVSVAGAGAWASGTNMNQAKHWAASGGIQTAAFVAAGATPPYSVNTEHYDGSTWTEVANISGAARYLCGGNGTTAASIIAGGANPTVIDLTETWNGSSWSAEATLGTARYNFGSICGTTAAGVIASGATFTGPTPSAQTITECESWNGSAWSEVNSLQTARGRLNQGGTQTAAIAMGGVTSPYPESGFQNKTETYDGTSWTEVNVMNTARCNLGAGSNSQTSMLVFGGSTTTPGSFEVVTESWDGTSWTEVADLASGIDNNMGAGASNASALSAGGTPPAAAQTNATEEWNDPAYTAKTVTVS